MRPLLVMERSDEARLPEADMLAALRGAWDETWGGLDEARVRVFELSFYEDTVLIEAEPVDALPRSVRLYFLCLGGDLFSLKGTSPPIHAANVKSRPLLNENTALDYLAFFCFFVHGEEGPFMIVDRFDNTYLPVVPDLEALRAAFRKPRIWGQDEKGNWRVTAVVYYANAIFVADFLVQLGGMIEMVGDDPIMGDLPNRVDAPLVCRRRELPM